MTADDESPEVPERGIEGDTTVGSTAGIDTTTAARPRDHDQPDPSEIVGPGRYPLRIQPAAAIQPGTADAKRLMVVWFIRKSFYWVFFLGFSAGVLATAIRNRGTGDLDADVDINWFSPESIADNVLSPWAGLILALVIRFIAGWVALALAFPLALAHEPNLSPRENFGSSIGKFFDRLHVARAFRALRWTHHVRQVALGRLGPTGVKVGKLDPIFDVVNIASGVIAFLTPFAAALIVA